MDIGIDGIKFFKSSKLSGWPIIGRIVGLDGIPPFLIGIYTGPAKPESFDELMTAFCDEIDEIERDGGGLGQWSQDSLFDSGIYLRYTCSFLRHKYAPSQPPQWMP